MTGDRLSPLDASFLHLEDATSHMHVGGALVFDGEPPAYDGSSRTSTRARPGAALSPAPGGGAARAGPAEVGRRRALRPALPRPPHRAARAGHASTSCRCSPAASSPSSCAATGRCGRCGSSRACEGGRFAILSKTHHALVDGISGLDILSVLFAPDEASTGPWQPRPAPSARRLLAEALLERATVAARARARRVRAAVRARARWSAGSRETRGRGGRAGLGRAAARAADALQRRARSAPTGASRGRARRSTTSRRSRTSSAGRSTTSC